MNTLDYAEPIATIDEFKAALLATRDWHGIAPMQLQMIQAQCRAAGSTISPLQMSEQLHLKSEADARVQYGTFARAIADKLGYSPPRGRKGRKALVVYPFDYSDIARCQRRQSHRMGHAPAARHGIARDEMGVMPGTLDLPWFQAQVLGLLCLVERFVVT